MTRPAAAPAIRLTLTPDGKVHGLLRGPARSLEGRIAIVLDGTIHRTLVPEIGSRGTASFEHALPPGFLHTDMDVLSLPSAESLLGVPQRLDAVYAFRMLEVESDNGLIAGAFTAAAFMLPEIGVEWLSAGTAVGQAVATRDGTQPDGQLVWRFRLPVRTLPCPRETRTLQPRIGGLLLASPLLTIGPDALGFLGFLDSASPNHVEGWAIDLKRPDRHVHLDVLVDTQTVATITASAPRQDLISLGYNSGHCGFSFRLPDHPDPTARRRVAVRLSGQRIELCGSPIIVDPVPGLAGSFDTLHGMSAHGWALDWSRPEMPVQVEVVGPNGEVLGTGSAAQFRGDLLDAGLNAGLCAFKVDLSAHFERLTDQEVIVRVAGTGQVLPGSPRRVATNKNIRRLLHRQQELPPETLMRLRRALNRRAGEHGISFIMPVHDTPRAWLIEALESVRAQFCDAWELICIDDGSKAAHVRQILAGYAARDPRIRVLHSAQNVGIARAVNFGLRAARHDYVAFMDHDDRLEPDAAWQLIRAAQMTDAGLLYTDEAQTAENINAITELRLRPAFSHDYYLSHPYFVHIVCARTATARSIGGWDETMAISADVDFVLRMIEACAVVTHVPAVLYRWRTHGGSTGHSKQSDVMTATTNAIQRHLDRLRTGALVQPGVWFNQFRIDWPEARGQVLIVMPTKNKVELLRTAIESIERTADSTDYKLVVIDHSSDEPATRAYLDSLAPRHIVMPYSGPFNFSAMNNAAVAQHGGSADFLLFLNNDIEATQPGWLDRLKRLANRRDVGAVGPLLMYVDQTVQHAGVVLGFNDSADHALKFQRVFLDDKGRRNLGYNCALTSVRDYSAVTAACLMLRRQVFDQVGGFDPLFSIGFNDTDLCLRIGALGLRVLYDGATILYHYESATRSQTKQVFHPEDTQRMITSYGALLKAGDPFYNPNLSLTTQDHVPHEDGNCRIVSLPRATRLSLSILAQKATDAVVPPG